MQNRQLISLRTGLVLSFAALVVLVGGTIFATTYLGSARAVGTACGENPIPIIIPCHRVLAGNSMGGYSGDGGLETKTALLRLEGALPQTLF